MNRVTEKAEEIKKALQQHGKYTLDRCDDELAQWLSENPDALNIRKIAHDTNKSLDESSRYKPTGQLDLWPAEDLDRIIPTGVERERIELRQAKKAELEGWLKEDTTNFLRQVTAYEKVRERADTLMKLLKPNENCGQLYARKPKLRP